MTCSYKKPGWYCIRAAGHDGPCAAVPTFWHALTGGYLRFWVECKVRGM